MGYKKCPRCELNYILDSELMCTMCKKDVSGEKEADDMLEMCSECGENPAMPGQELCSECYKAMQQQHRNAVNNTDDSSVIDPSSHEIDIDSVSGMEEMEEVKSKDEDGMDFSEDDDTLRDEDDDDEDSEDFN